MNGILKRKQKQRIEFLHKIYEMTDGRTDETVNGAEVATQIGLKDDEERILRDIATYLKDEGLIDVQRVIGGFPAYVQLTHHGVVEIEKAIENPDQPTQHFMPINILNVKQMIGSHIQQGTIDSVQTLINNSDATKEISRFLEVLEKSIHELNLSTEHENELEAELATIEAQVNSPKPKRNILKECLSSVKGILESAAGSAIGAQLASQIPALLSLF